MRNDQVVVPTFNPSTGLKIKTDKYLWVWGQHVLQSSRTSRTIQKLCLKNKTRERNERLGGIHSMTLYGWGGAHMWRLHDQSLWNRFSPSTCAQVAAFLASVLAAKPGLSSSGDGVWHEVGVLLLLPPKCWDSGRNCTKPSIMEWLF